MSQWWYYDFMNLNSALSQALIKEGYIGNLHYVKDIASVKVSEFKYKNIEKIPELTSEILEMALLFFFQLCVYEVPGIGIGLFRYVTSNVYSRYMKPITVNILTLKGDTVATNVPYQDIIPVRDNSMDIIPFLCMMEYIRKLEKIDTACFKALDVATLPVIISGNKKAAKTLQETAKALGGPGAFIVGDDTMQESVKAFDINVRINPTDIYELKNKYKNECLASIGVYSIEQKRERKLVDEIRSQNDYTERIYWDMKTQRDLFIKKINEKYGLDIELVETRELMMDRTIQEVEDRAIAQKAGDNNDSTNS